MATFPRGHSARHIHNEKITQGGTNTSKAKLRFQVTGASELRFIPAIGPDVAGQIPGTRPDTSKINHDET